MGANPLKSPRSFDTFTIDGIACPGIARIQSGGEREEEWQEAQTPGETGANILFRYEHVSKITADDQEKINLIQSTAEVSIDFETIDSFTRA